MTEKLKNFDVNWNLYGVIEVSAKNEEDAREKVDAMDNDKILKFITDEAYAGGFEIGTVEEEVNNVFKNK